jgi:hypothetical protein
MTFDRKILPILCVPVVGLIIPLLLWNTVSLKPPLRPHEKTLINFTPVLPNVARPVPQTFVGIQCPVQPSAFSESTVSAYPPVALETLLPSGKEKSTRQSVVNPESTYSVSMVLVNENRKLAIINDRVVKEGDYLNSYRVSSIEQNKVHLKGSKGDLWLKTE